MADEYTSGGTVYYRISDKKNDSVNVQDTTLYGSFGDLSDGSGPVCEVVSGTETTITVMDFVMKKRPHFGDQGAPLVGYDLNINTIEDADYTGTDTSYQGYNPLPLTDIYMMKKDEQIEFEGNVQMTDNAGSTKTTKINDSGAAANFVRADLAAFVSHSSYESTPFLMQEDFSGSSDIGDDLYKYTSHGKVFAGRAPYLSVEDAYEYMSGWGNNGRKLIQTNKMGEAEMKGFYGEPIPKFTSNGSIGIYIIPQDDDGSKPPENWKVRTKKGNPGKWTEHHLLTGSTKGGSESGMFVNEFKGSDYNDNQYLGLHNQRDVAVSMLGIETAVATASSYQGHQFVKPFIGPVTQAVSASAPVEATSLSYAQRFGAYVKPVGGAGMRTLTLPAAVMSTLAISAYGETNRFNNIMKADQTGDFSGLNRPMYSPTWKHKDIKDKIQYADVYEEFTLTERDETAVTITSSWWDKVKEVPDYPKLSQGAGTTATDAGVSTGGSNQTYGSAEAMLAKSSINFSNENTFNGGNMRMCCYHDVDLAYHPNKQLGFNFGAAKSKMQQDIFVSKYNLPAPVSYFQSDRTTLPRNSQGYKEPPTKYEISFKMNIADLSNDYSIGSGSPDVTNTQSVFRRGFAITFSNKKPKDNDSLKDYVHRHAPTSDGAAWESALMGFIIHNKGDVTDADDEGPVLVPFAHLAETGSAGEEKFTVSRPIKTDDTFTDDLVPSDLAATVHPRIPASQWLEYKMSFDANGGSGRHHKNEGRCLLSVHKAEGSEKGEPIDAFKDDGEFEVVSGIGTPLALVATTDVNQVGTDVAFQESINQDKWLKHMTVWLCNHRNMSGGGYNKVGELATDGTQYWHDTLSAGSMAVTQAVNEKDASTPTAFSPYELAKQTVHIDEFKITGVQPKAVNMSVNTHNTMNSVSQNVINHSSLILTKPAGPMKYSLDRVDTNVPASQKTITYDSCPTVLSLGFTTTTNLAGASDGSPKFLLFNDFYDTAGTESPTPFTDAQMTAAFMDNTEIAMGDWIDKKTKFSTDTGLNIDGVKQFVDSTTDVDGAKSATDVEITVDDGSVFSVGNIIARSAGTTDEIMQITGIAGDVITITRGMFGTTPGVLDNNASLWKYNTSFTVLTVDADASALVGGGDFIKVGNEFMIVDSVGGTGNKEITVSRSGGKFKNVDCPDAHPTYTAGNNDVKVAIADGAAINVLGKSLFGNLTIGAGAGNDIITSKAEDDVYDSNIGADAKAYVEGFSQKGFLQFENALANWTRRENPYASSRILALGAPDDSSSGSGNVNTDTSIFTIGDESIIGFEQDELYIIYKHGQTWGTDGATAFHTTNGGACIVKVIEKKGGVVTVVRDTTVKSGTTFDNLLTEANLPLLHISPYRYWLAVNLDTNGGILKVSGDAQLPERAYGSILPVAPPSSGYNLGMTYNEKTFYTNTDGQTHYAKRRSFDISEGVSAPYELSVDFGYGTWDEESRMGGQVRTFIPKFGPNRIAIDNLTSASLKEGDIVSLLLSANGANTPSSQMTFFSGDLDSSSYSGVNAADEPKLIPQLATKYFDTSPKGCNLIVAPSQGNPVYPTYGITVNDDDIWYGYFMLDTDFITDKYHKIVGYCPLNENVDTAPWKGKRADMRGGDNKTIISYKMYRNQESIGHERIGNSNYLVSYATQDGLYNGTNYGSLPQGTMEGLGGRALDTRNQGTLRVTEATGYAGLGGLTKFASVVIHMIGEKDAADGVILEIDDKVTAGNKSNITISQVSNRVQAVVHDNDGNAFTLTSVRSLPRDGETPACVILVIDTEILEGNIKLYIDGELEAQTGSLASAATTSNWKNGNTILLVGNEELNLGACKGVYEEIIVYELPIYPFSMPKGASTEITIDKNLEEIADSDTGVSQVWNARAFVFDYHNLRGDTCGQSTQVSHKKTAFAIDGT